MCVMHQSGGHDRVTQLHNHVTHLSARLFVACAQRDLKPQNLLLTNEPPLSRAFAPCVAHGSLLGHVAHLKFYLFFLLVLTQRDDRTLLTAASPFPPTVKIADFGFARELLPQTMAATLCGSPLYMAPEILGYKKYDGRSDLWSLGAILFEMVTGKPPFLAANHVEVHIAQVLAKEIGNSSYGPPLSHR